MSTARGCIDVAKETKVYAIGDLEGDILLLYHFLIENKILNKDNIWINENIYVVQCGDQVDRKRSVLTNQHKEYIDVEMLIFTRILNEISKGRFLSVIGNHEMMNCFGDFGYVNPVNVELLPNKVRKILFKKTNTNISNHNILRESILERFFILRIGSLVFSHAGISSAMLRIARSLNKGYTSIDQMIHDVNSQLTDENIDELSRFRSANNDDSENSALKKFFGISNPILETQTNYGTVQQAIESASYVGVKTSDPNKVLKQYHFGVLWDRNFHPTIYQHYMNYAASMPEKANEIYAQYSVPNLDDGRGTFTQVIGHNNSKGDVYMLDLNKTKICKEGSIELSKEPTLFMIDSYKRGSLYIDKDNDENNDYSIKSMMFVLNKDGTINSATLLDNKVNKQGLTKYSTNALNYLKYLRTRSSIEHLKNLYDSIEVLIDEIEERERLIERINKIITSIISILKTQNRDDLRKILDILEVLKLESNIERMEDKFKKISSHIRAKGIQIGGLSQPPFKQVPMKAFEQKDRILSDIELDNMYKEIIADGLRPSKMGFHPKYYPPPRQYSSHFNNAVRNLSKRNLSKSLSKDKYVPMKFTEYFSLLKAPATRAW